MRLSRRAVGCVIVAATTLSACGPRPLRFDAERAKTRCGVTGLAAIDATQARCLARLAGLVDRRGCPLEVEEDHERDSFRLRESCSGIAVHVARANGAVVAVEYGTAIAPGPRTESP